MVDPEENQPSPFELKDILFALIRSWFLIGIFGLLGLAGGIYLAASKTNYYSSKAQLLLHMGARESITQEESAGVASGRGREVSTGIEDEIHMLTDPEIYRGLAQKLTPADVLSPADPTRHENQNFLKGLFHQLQARLTKVDESEQAGGGTVKKASEVLMKNTVVRSERYSKVISVFHTSSTPEKAQRHCQAILDAFRERHRRQYSSLEAAENTKLRSEETKEKLDIAEADLYSHLQECGNSQEVDEVEFGKNHYDLKAEVRQHLTRSEVIAAETAELVRQLAEIPEEVEVKTPEVTRTSVEYDAKITQRADWLVEKENIQFLNISLAEKERRMRVYDERIAEIDQALLEIDRVELVQEAGVELVTNEKWTNKKAEIDVLNIEAAGLAVEIEKGTERLAEMVAEGAEMLSCKQLHKQMSRTVDGLEEDYDRQLNELERVRTLADLDLQDKTNLQELKKPDLPLDKAGPARGKLVLIGLMGGLMAGAALAFLRQLADPKLRHPHAAARALGNPVIVVVPEKKALRALHKTVPVG